MSRANIGLCLGAYRDLVLLIQSTPEVHRQLQALVLCNDSNLLVQPPETLVAQLEQWTSQSEVNAKNAELKPVLAGLTDSAQRGCYHLQSFLLHANQALLQHPAWLRFWLQFAVDGSKDDLINNGEIGLSCVVARWGRATTFLSNGSGVADRSSYAEELFGYGIVQPEHVNQSLFAWRSLLAVAFHSLKSTCYFSWRSGGSAAGDRRAGLLDS